MLQLGELVDSLARAMRIVLVLSLLFELVVAVFIREPITPLWVDYSDLDQIPQAYDWSRDLLFAGGLIQCIVGNILAMAALLSLIAEVARAVAGRASRVGSAVWLVSRWWYLRSRGRRPFSSLSSPSPASRSRPGSRGVGPAR